MKTGKKIRKKRFFLTWQEASRACIEMGVKGGEDYICRYKEISSKLPSDPPRYYPDWPGWHEFLGKRLKKISKPKRDFFPTWQEASRECIKAGIITGGDYKENYFLISPRLPSNPSIYYPDWPGWHEFLGKRLKKISKPKRDFFPTWQEASRECGKAGVNRKEDYNEKYFLISPRLPSDPPRYYPDWPGWHEFLQTTKDKRRKKNFYSTWQQASEICIKAGVEGKKDYSKRYYRISQKLPSSPESYYSDWPGWKIFTQKFFLTWQEASLVCIENGIKDCKNYRIRYWQISSRLPSKPELNYSDWPGWRVFLNKIRK